MRITLGIVLVFAVVFVLLVLAFKAWAGHPGQNWDELEPDPAIRAWMSTLMQPDTLAGRPISCCGESDAYWADKVSIVDDEVYATVEDDRDDTKLGRQHVPNGTRFKIPPNKIVGEKQPGNPSGHAVIFLGSVIWLGGMYHPAQRAILCYVPNGSF